jgi:hypothetical protein
MAQQYFGDRRRGREVEDEQRSYLITSAIKPFNGWFPRQQLTMDSNIMRVTGETSKYRSVRRDEPSIV